MKKMDSLGLKLCSYQATLFEKSRDDLECSSKVFIRRFMNSEIAKRMDKVGFLFEATDIKDSFAEIELQYGKSTYGSDKYDIEELHWIGYIYRYWSYISEKSSKQLYKLIKPNELKKLYFPYHSLDPAQAIERISEEINASYNDDITNIARGVEIMRKVRRK